MRGPGGEDRFGAFWYWTCWAVLWLFGGIFTLMLVFGIALMARER